MQSVWQNLAKKDPGRGRQNSVATAGTNFTKPGAHYLVVLSVHTFSLRSRAMLLRTAQATTIFWQVSILTLIPPLRILNLDFILPNMSSESKDH